MKVKNGLFWIKIVSKLQAVNLFCKFAVIEILT